MYELCTGKVEPFDFFIFRFREREKVHAIQQKYLLNDKRR